MVAPAILLRSPTDLSSAPSSSSSPGAGAISIDSDMVVILASLLCALICVAGLALLARCACRRAAASPAATASTSSPPHPPPIKSIKSKGLKKKAIDALPTVAFAASQGQGECAICLAEFAAGEELRVLPHCAHGFHVACIDTWLGAHATCPSCRATIGSSPSPPLPGRCQRCGVTCDDDGAGAVAGDESFLP